MACPNTSLSVAIRFPSPVVTQAVAVHADDLDDQSFAANYLAPALGIHRS